MSASSRRAAIWTISRSWPGANEADWSGPGQLREIVQIAALRLDADTFEVVDQFDTLVRPVVNRQISPYLTELTGIDQTRIESEAIAPATALSDFLGFCRHQAVFSYGNDMIVLGENVGWARARGDALANGFLTASFLNLRPLINAVAPVTLTANVGRLWQVLGLPSPSNSGGEHSALFVCLSLATALQHHVEELAPPLRYLIAGSATGSLDLGKPDPR